MGASAAEGRATWCGHGQEVHSMRSFFFFFQAEDGIRDLTVTGVQTCALPILANTLELAQRCAFELPLGAPQFPAFVTPDGSTPHAFLRKLVLEGLRRRYRERDRKSVV